MVKALKFRDMFKVKHNSIRPYKTQDHVVSTDIINKWFTERHKFSMELMTLPTSNPMVFWLQSLDHRFVMTSSVACRLGVCDQVLSNGEDFLVYRTIAKYFRCSNDKGKNIVAEGVARGDLMYVDPPDYVTTKGACFTATDKIIHVITKSLEQRDIILQTKEGFLDENT